VRDACQCLNESPDHRFPAIFLPFSTTPTGEETTEVPPEEGEYLESNVDEQLLLLVKFTPRLKLHEIQLQAFNDGSAPKSIRVFVDQPHLGFDNVGDAIPTQEVTLSEEDLAKGSDNVLRIPLKLNKFHKVDTVSLFVEDNMGGKKRTRIKRIRFIGDIYEKVVVDLTRED